MKYCIETGLPLGEYKFTLLTGHKAEYVSGDISWNNATLYLHMHDLRPSGMCVIAG